MNMLSAVTVAAPRLALLVDGENLSAALAGRLIARSLAQGSPVIRRVYGDAARVSGWDAAPGFKLVHAGRGKNAADMLLCIEAMALVQAGQVEGIVVASSDGDFSHLATHLREAGVLVIGMGEAKAPAHWRKCCTRFEVLTVEAAAAPPQPKPAKAAALTVEQALEQAVQGLLSQAGAKGLAIAELNVALRGAVPDFKIADTPYKNWRGFLTARPAVFALDAKGPEARVRLARQRVD